MVAPEARLSSTPRVQGARFSPSDPFCKLLKSRYPFQLGALGGVKQERARPRQKEEERCVTVFACYSSSFFHDNAAMLSVHAPTAGSTHPGATSRGGAFSRAARHGERRRRWRLLHVGRRGLLLLR